MVSYSQEVLSDFRSSLPFKLSPRPLLLLKTACTGSSLPHSRCRPRLSTSGMTEKSGLERDAPCSTLRFLNLLVTSLLLWRTIKEGGLCLGLPFQWAQSPSWHGSTAASSMHGAKSSRPQPQTWQQRANSKKGEAKHPPPCSSVNHFFQQGSISQRFHSFPKQPHQKGAMSSKATGELSHLSTTLNIWSLPSLVALFLFFSLFC